MTISIQKSKQREMVIKVLCSEQNEAQKYVDIYICMYIERLDPYT